MNATRKTVMSFVVSCAAAVCCAADIYVEPAPTGDDETGDGSQGAPFATIAKGIAKAKDDITGGDASATVHIGQGTYTEWGLVLDEAIAVVGEGATRGDVIIDANSKGRAFTLGAEGAALRNLTVQNGKITDGGANVNMSCGVISNCVIKGGTANLSSGEGGNVYMTNGSLTDCHVFGGSGNGSNSAYGYSIYATGGRICRCEIRDAIYEKLSSVAVALAGAVVLENSLISGCNAGASGRTPSLLEVNNADARVVNCTVVRNVAKKYGVYVRSGTVVNTVIYDNGGTAEKEWGKANADSFVNCAFAGSAAYSGTTSTVLGLTDGDFANAGLNDWHLSILSCCVDVGSDEQYPADCSQTDLDGRPRKSPASKPIDIGCYELDQSEKIAVSGEAAFDYVHLGSSLDFTATAIGDEGPYTYKWDFGDGSAALETSETTVGYTYAAPGLYEVSVTAKTGADDYVTPFVLPVRICVARQDLYVDSNGGDDAGDGSSDSPFKTLAKAFSCLTNNISGDVTAVDGVTVHIVAGSTCEGHGFQIGSAVTVQGEGATRDNVVIDANSKGRAFTLGAEGAALRNLTVQNGRITSGSGANVNMSGGVISNCVIKGGTEALPSGGMGGNVYMTSGLLTDCRILGGSGNGSNSSEGYSICATGGRICRCEIRDAVYQKVSSVAVALSGAVVLENSLISGCEAGEDGRTPSVLKVNDADAKVVNCTVVRNVARKYGVRVESGTVVNTVIYDNGGTAEKEWGNAKADSFVNCAFAENAAYSGTTSTVKDLTSSAFKDYANGDYRLAKGDSVLKGAGTTWNDYLAPYGAISLTDLAGKPRKTGRNLDIGCYAGKGPGGLVFYLR